MEILLSHAFGDYLLQTKSMALNKTSNSLVCFVHCLIYTLCVALFFGLDWSLLVVLASHYAIDRYSLASHWLKLIRGRTFEGAILGHETGSPKQQFDVAFTSIVYTVVDNTFHLFILWALYS